MMPFTFTKWTTRFVVVQLLVLHVKLGTLWLKIVMSLYACVATQWEGQGCTFALSCCTTSGCCLTCTHKRLRTSIPFCSVALHVLNRFDFIINKNVWGWGCGKRLPLSQSCRCYSQLRWPVCLFPANRLSSQWFAFISYLASVKPFSQSTLWNKPTWRPAVLWLTKQKVWTACRWGCSSRGWSVVPGMTILGISHLTDITRSQE